MNIFLDMEPLNEGFLDNIKEEFLNNIKQAKKDFAETKELALGTIYKAKDYLSKTKIPDSVYIEYEINENVFNLSCLKKDVTKFLPLPNHGKNDNKYYFDFKEKSNIKIWNIKTFEEFFGKKIKIKINPSLCQKLIDKFVTVEKLLKKKLNRDYTLEDEFANCRKNKTPLKNNIFPNYPDAIKNLNNLISKDPKNQEAYCILKICDLRNTVEQTIQSRIIMFLKFLSTDAPIKFSYAYHNQK